MAVGRRHTWPPPRNGLEVEVEARSSPTVSTAASVSDLEYLTAEPLILKQDNSLVSLVILETFMFKNNVSGMFTTLKNN